MDDLALDGIGKMDRGSCTERTPFVPYPYGVGYIFVGKDQRSLPSARTDVDPVGKARRALRTLPSLLLEELLHILDHFLFGKVQSLAELHHDPLRDRRNVGL
jgi:hypothetical protein